MSNYFEKFDKMLSIQALKLNPFSYDTEPLKPTFYTETVRFVCIHSYRALHFGIPMHFGIKDKADDIGQGRPAVEIQARECTPGCFDLTGNVKHFFFLSRIC